MASEDSAFRSRLFGMCENVMLTYAIAIGSKLGLFDVIADLEKPETVESIAEKAQLRERWVLAYF